MTESSWQRMRDFFAQLSQRMRQFEGYAIEVGVSLCSLWATFALLHPPSNFQAYQGAYLMIATITPDEAFWGTWAAAAAAGKLIGLTLCYNRRCPNLGIRLRQSGLALSASFWTLLGISTIVGNLDTLLGVPVLLLAGASSWWALLRHPLMPGEALP